MPMPSTLSKGPLTSTSSAATSSGATSRGATSRGATSSGATSLGATSSGCHVTRGRGAVTCDGGGGCGVGGVAWEVWRGRQGRELWSCGSINSDAMAATRGERHGRRGMGGEGWEAPRPSQPPGGTPPPERYGAWWRVCVCGPLQRAMHARDADARKHDARGKDPLTWSG